MKKTVKIFSIMLVSIMMLSVLSPMFAYIDPKTLNGTPPTDDGIVTIGNTIIGILTTIGIVVSVVVLLILGIKYMMGSASEKAEYKKTMIPYLIGAVLIFGASSVASMVINLAPQG